MPEFFNLNTPHGPHTGSDRRHEGHTQEYQQGGGAVPLAPPRNMLPVDLIGGPATKIMDVSKDLLSVSDMKEELKDNKIFRFEKVVDKDRLDDHGRPKLHGWEQAIRTEDRSISKKAATEKIRELNYRTKDVLDKKSSLTPPLKRQLDRTLEELMSQEPDLANFHWLLVQIDHQLRPIEPYYYISSSHQHGRGHRHSTYHLTSKRKSHSRSRSSSSRHSKRRVYERLSLTAYFQRAPRPGVNIPRLWEEKRRALESMYPSYPIQLNHNQFQNQRQTTQQQQQPNHNQNQNQNQRPTQQQPNQNQRQTQQPNQAQAQRPMQQQQPNHNQPQTQHHGGRGQGPPPGPPPGQHQQPQQNRPMNHNTHQNHGGGGHQQNPNARRARVSDSGSGSESDSRSSHSTAPSSVSDSRGGIHQNPVRGPGNRPHPHPLKTERPRAPRSMHRPPPPPPPYPVSSGEETVASHIERVREEAFRRGRLAERSDARLVEELAFQKTHGRARPRVVQEHSPRRPTYRVGSDDGLRRYMSRLSLYGGEDDELEYRAQRGSILEEDPFLNSPPPSSYAYSTDGRGYRRGSQVFEVPEHPLSPRLRRTRPYY